MELNFRQSESDVKPSLVTVLPREVYIRKNIKEVERPGMGPNEEPRTVYTYDEARLTPMEYKLYLIEQAADKNNDTLMMAIAELADMVSALA